MRTHVHPLVLRDAFFLLYEELLIKPVIPWFARSDYDVDCLENGPSGQNLPYLGVAASIKLLMAVPERIWAAIEDQQLTKVNN